VKTINIVVARGNREYMQRSFAQDAMSHLEEIEPGASRHCLKFEPWAIEHHRLGVRFVAVRMTGECPTCGHMTGNIHATTPITDPEGT